MSRARTIVFALALLVGGLLVSADAQVAIRRGWAKAFFTDGSNTAPSMSFSSDPDTGFFWGGSGHITMAANTTRPLDFGSQLSLASDSTIGWSTTAGNATAATDTTLNRAAAGILTAGTASTPGIRLQFNAAPTVASGFGTTPSITTGSTDTAGSVNVGTGGTATQGIVQFNATWSAAPFCTATNATTTAGNTRALGASASTTQLTITAATAWAASTVVNWTCIGAK